MNRIKQVESASRRGVISIIRHTLIFISFFAVSSFQVAIAGQIVWDIGHGKAQPKSVGEELTVLGTTIRINRYTYESNNSQNENSPENVIGIWLDNNFYYITNYEQDGYGDLIEDIDRFVTLNYGFYNDYLMLEAYGTGSDPAPYLFLFKAQKKSIKLLDATRGCISVLRSGKFSTYPHPNSDLLDFQYFNKDSTLSLKMACGKKADQITYLHVEHDRFESSPSLLVGHKRNKKAGFRLEKLHF